MSTKQWIFNTGDGWLFPISNKNSMTFHKDVCARSATLTIVVITVTAGLVFTKHNQIPFCNPNQIPSVFFLFGFVTLEHWKAQTNSPLMIVASV